MKQSTKNILMFIGGFIWAMKTTTKAYAPTIIKTPPSPPKNPTSQEDCPEGSNMYGGICPPCQPGGNCTCSPNYCSSECPRGNVKIPPYATTTMGLYGRENAFDCRGPINSSECPDGTTFIPEQVIGGNIPGQGAGVYGPAYCEPAKRNTRLEAQIKQVGSWTPNDTTCTPCTTMNYQGGRHTARVHKSWCDINCASEVKRANELRNPFNVINTGPYRGYTN